METIIANTKHLTASAKKIFYNLARSKELSLFILVLALVMLVMSLNLEMSTVVGYYEEMQQELDKLEKLLENPAIVIGNK